MLTVACVYKPGAGFTDEYVYRLQTAVAKHLTLPYHFVCYTDQRLDGVIINHLAPGLQGWFSKAALWLVPRLWNEPILYFDLDTMIIGNIDHIASCTETTLIDDVWSRLRSQRAPVRQTALMYLTTRALLDLARSYNPDTFQRGGDANYVRQVLNRSAIYQDWAPNQICSWKVEWAKGIRHPDTRVICFHGKPRPHEINWDLAIRV